MSQTNELSTDQSEFTYSSYIEFYKENKKLFEEIDDVGNKNKSVFEYDNSARLIDNRILEFCVVFEKAGVTFTNQVIPKECVLDFNMSQLWLEVDVNWDGICLLLNIGQEKVEPLFKKAVLLDLIYPDGSLHPIIDHITKGFGSSLSQIKKY